MTDTNVKQQVEIISGAPNVARNYKDRIFRMVFKEKKALLALYNAMNHTEYTDEDALTVTTLENAIYMEMKNDVSFVLYDQLLLYEHQSTKNPNIPLRNLFYVSDIYSALTRNKFLYGSVPVKIPEPKFVVFYNGEEATEERETLRLSALYEKKSEHVVMELETEVLNINIGYNRELMEHCRELHDYAQFVSCVRENMKKNINLTNAVNVAVDECIQNGILAEFLEKNRAEVVKMSIYEYDAEKVQRQFREEWEMIGKEKGLELAKVVFHMHYAGKSLEEIALKTGLTEKEIESILE